MLYSKCQGHKKKTNAASPYSWITTPKNIRHWRNWRKNDFNITSEKARRKLTSRQKVVSPQMYTQVYTIQYCLQIIALIFLSHRCTFLIRLFYYYYYYFIFRTRPYIIERVVKPITFFRFVRFVICNGRAWRWEEKSNPPCAPFVLGRGTTSQALQYSLLIIIVYSRNYNIRIILTSTWRK